TVSYLGPACAGPLSAHAPSRSSGAGVVHPGGEEPYRSFRPRHRTGYALPPTGPPLERSLHVAPTAGVVGVSSMVTHGLDLGRGTGFARPLWTRHRPGRDSVVQSVECWTDRPP